MEVLITSAYADSQPISAFREIARRDRFGVHHLTDDPERADVILFVENSQYHYDAFFRVLRRHPWVREHPEKCFMYNEHDRPYCPLPGLYCSMPRRYFDRSRQRACDYVITHNPYIQETARDVAPPDLLFSFVGRRNAPVRDRILELRHPAAHIQDTTHFDAYLQERNVGEEALNYAQVMRRSRFVLCPRGVGTGSQRLFETMQAGRVPVILSDEWVEPDGPCWEEISVRIPESQVASIPARLEDRDPHWAEMARAARAAWEEWFAPEVKFHRMVEGCLEILRSRRRPEAVAQRIPRPFPLYTKNRARSVARRVLLAVGKAR
jgi:hypothetical protein